MQQLACVFSPIEQLPDGSFQPIFVGTMQTGEKCSGSIDLLPDGTAIPVTKDFVPGGDALITAQGLTVCYVLADETRVTAADSNANYLVLWRMYIAPPYTTTQLPTDNMTGAELSAISAYLTLRTGYLSTQISQWLINQFGVASQAQAVTWATSRPRTATVNKLMIAMSRWVEAKAELDVL